MAEEANIKTEFPPDCPSLLFDFKQDCSYSTILSKNVAVPAAAAAAEDSKIFKQDDMDLTFQGKLETKLEDVDNFFNDDAFASL